MFNQGRQSPDAESVSTNTTDITSRATTPQTSWSMSTLQRKMDRLNQFNVQPIDDDRTSNHSKKSDHDDADAVADINKNREENQQQTWPDPYRDPNFNSRPMITEADANPGDDKPVTKRSSSITNAEKVNSNPILINSDGVIDDLSWGQNEEFKPSLSNTSFNPTGEYVSYNSDGSSSYISPSHTQRPTDTSPPPLTSQPKDPSSSKRSSASSNLETVVRSVTIRPQPYPETIENNIRSWINPNPTKSSSNSPEQLEKKNSNQYENVPTSRITKRSPPIKSHVDRRLSEKSTTSTESLKKPYWKDHKSDDSLTHITQPNKSWKNSFSKDSNISKLDRSSISLRKSSSFNHRTPKIPSFYRRIYPPTTPLSSPAPIKTTKHNTIFPRRIPEKNISDDEDLSFTIDSRGVAHYQAATPPPPANGRYRSQHFAPSSINAQYPVLPPQACSPVRVTKTITTSIPSFQSAIAPTLFSNVNHHSPSSCNYHRPPNCCSATILTETDLHSIHDALHLLETNPDAIPVIETSNHIPTLTITQQCDPPPILPAQFTSFFTTNRDLRQQPPSAFTRYPHFNSQQSPLFSTPSYPSDLNQSTQILTRQRSIVLI